MNNTYRMALEKYERETGEVFCSELYPTPDSVPRDLLNLVRHVKMAQASSRQTAIYYEMQAFRKGDAVFSPEDKQHLMTEFTECKAQLKLWEKA